MVWILLTTVFTVLAGVYAAGDRMPLFWTMLGIWLFTGFLLMVCKPGEKPSWTRR
jgi:hypothetical protein